MSTTVLRCALLMGLALGVSACAPSHDGAAGKSSVRQTQFPGQVSAGGQTSGQLMQDAGAMKETPDPEGTPGIPQGAGGNTGGAAMGGEARGTSPVKGTEHRDSTEEPEPLPERPLQPSQSLPEAAPDPKSEAKRKEEAKAVREKQELEASMDAVAVRWHARAASNGWSPLLAPPVDTSAGVAGQPGSVPARFMRTEKEGTAPASADIKPAPSPDSESGTP